MSSNTTETQFAKTALELGLITKQQLAVCRRLQKRARAQGRQLSLVSCLVKKGYLQTIQISQITQHCATENSTISQGSTARSGSSTVVTQISTGDFLGHYRLITEIGRGGMGRVYKAYDPRLERTVALKILTASDNRTDIERFVREAKATAKLRHPYIVEVYDIGNEQGLFFFTMEYIQGQSLQQLQQTNPLSTRQLVDIMIKIGEAMYYAHRQGVIHRDLKPANIMINQEYEPKVMDFGLAKLQRSSKQLSQSGMVIGTLHYMPPEQAEGKIRAIDERSDVYALGAILYEMLTGRPPFVGTSFSHMIKQILQVDPIPPADLKPGIHKDLESICLKALQKRKEKRYQSAASFVDDLWRFKRGETVEARSLGYAGRLWRKIRQHKVVLGIASAVLFCLLGWAASIWTWSWLKRVESIQQLMSQARQILVHVSNARQLDQQYDLQAHLDRPLSQEVRQEIEYALQHYMRARICLDQALALAPGDQQVRIALYKVEREIGLLALLARNYILSPIFFERCRHLGDPQAEKLLQLVRTQKEAIRKKQVEHIHYVMEQLSQVTPPEGLVDQYVTELVRMPGEHTVKVLLSYLSSKYEWPRLVAIEALGKIGDHCTKFQGRDVGQWLMRHLEKLDLKTDMAEAEAVIWALGRLRDARANRLVYKVRCTFGRNSAFWRRTELPYTWLPMNQTYNLAQRNAQDCNQQGEMHLYKRQYDQAIRQFTRAIRLDPRLAQAYNNRGRAYCLQVDLGTMTNQDSMTKIVLPALKHPQTKVAISKALKDFNQAIAIDPRLADAYINRAVLRHIQGDLSGALADYNRAIQLAPRQGKLYLNRGMMYYAQNNFAAALADYSKLIALQPDAWEAYNYRGLIYCVLGQLKAALADLNQAIRLCAKDPMVYNHRAIIYIRQEQLEAALADLNQSIRLDPQNTLAYGNRALVYQRLRNYRAALADYNQILKIDPANAKTYYKRGILYYRLNFPRKARRDFQQAVKYRPQFKAKIQRFYQQQSARGVLVR